MGSKSGKLTVGTTRRSLLDFQKSDSSQEQRWSGYNAGTVTVWTGDENVVVGEGIPIPPGAWGRETIKAGEKLYGVSTADTQLNISMRGV